MVYLHNRTLYQTIIPHLTYVTLWQHLIRWLPCGVALWSTRYFLQWGGPVTTARMAVLWWRLHYFCHVRLGVNFMSWSNFCVLVWLPLSRRDFITLSDIIRIYGHVMVDFITLWWSRESWYDFSQSWLKFSSRCDFVCLGVILHLGAINWILVWFFFALANFSS